MPIGSTNVYNSGDLILSTVSGSGTSFIETKIIAATSSLILFNASGTLTSQSLNSTTVGTSSFVSGSTSIITNLTASNISASSKIQANQLTASSILANNGPLMITGSNAYVQMFPVGGSPLPSSLTASYIYTSGSTNDMYFTQYNGPYTNTTRLRWIESNLYTGILHGGVLTSTPGSTTFTITNGEGIIVTMNAFTASAPYPTVKLVSWPTSTQPIINSGSAKITYVGIDNVGAIVQQTNAWGSSDINQWDNQISLGVVLHLSGSVSTGVFNSPQISYANPQQADDFFRSFGPLKISGHTLQASGSSPTLSIKKSGGTAYREGANYLINPNHPSTVVENAINTSKIYRYYLSGSTPIIDTGVANAGYTTIDNDNYVNTATGQLASVGNSNWTIQRVFWVPNSPTNAFLVYYGNASYPTLLDAVNAKDSEPFTEAPNTALNSIFVGYIIIEGGAGRDLLNSAECTIIQGGLFRNVGGIGSSGTAPVSTTLAGLSDVALSGLSAGDLLVYGGGQWNNNKTLTGNYIVSGSLSVTSGVTANLTGTSSWATNAVTSSFALTASYVNGSTSIITNLTASNISASGTIIANSFTGSFSGSITNAVTAISASFSTNSLTASYLTPTNSYTITNLTASNISASNALSSSNVWFGNSMVYVETMTTGSLTAPDVNFTSTAITGSDVMMKIDATALTGSAVALQINASGSQTSYAISASNGTIIGTIFSGSAFSGNFTGSVFGTSSWATNSLTASYLTPSNSYTITNLTASNITASGTSIFGTVGIGTNNPTARLHVSGSTGGVFEVDTIGGATTLYVSSSGNVGVGTTSSLSKLSVYASGSDLSVFRVDGANGTLFEVTDNLSGSLFSVNTIAGFPVLEAFSDNTVVAGKYGSNVFVLTGSNIGIGTNVPAFTLDVSGSSRHGFTSTNTHQFTGSVNITGPVTATSFTGSFSGSIGTAVSSSYALSASYAPVNTNITASWATNALTASSLVAANSYTITNLTASNVSASLTGSFGIVGIGTTSPSYKLDVNGNANFTNGFYTNTDASSTSYFVGANGTRPIIFQNNTGASYDFGFKFYDSNTFTIVGGNTLANPTTDLVSFTYDGKVGIGTTGPSALLHINTGSINSTAYPLLIDNSSGGAGVNVVGIGFANGGVMKHSITTAVYGNDYMAFNVGQGASYNQERVRIDSNGNVGIGTTTVSRKIHAYTATGPVMRLQTSGSNASIEFGPSLGTTHNYYNWLVGAQQNVSNAFEITPSTATNGSTFSTPALLITSAGNVGIGVTAPLGRLHITGSATSGETLLYLSKGTGSFSQNYINAVDQAGSINYRVTSDINGYSQQTLYRSGTSYVYHDAYWSSWINNANYAQGGLALGTGSLTHGYALNISRPATSGSLYVSGSSVFTGSVSISGSVTFSGPIIYDNAVLLDYGSTSTPVVSTNYAVLQNLTGSYNSAFFDYFASSGSNFRAGTVIAGWSGSSINYTEYSTTDVGNTNELSMSVDLSGSFVRLLTRVSTTINWNIKSTGRYL